MRAWLKCGLMFVSLQTLADGVLAQEFSMRTPITVRAFVHDPNGLPVVGAKVGLSTTYYRNGNITGEDHEQITGKDGFAIVMGVAETEYALGVTKLGYYRTAGPHRSIDTPGAFQRFAAETQYIDFELKPIRNPTRSVGKFVDRVLIPSVGSPVGFDLEIGDWTAPYGAGKARDFIFTLKGYFNGLRDFDQSLTLEFANDGDGIRVERVLPRVGSEFIFPYQAPADGYESRMLWKDRRGPDGGGNSFDFSGATNYIFRVRTRRDVRGNVLGAIYGVVRGEISVGGNNVSGRNLSFVYQLNPDWTRNLEFDRAKEVLAGTGKLLVSPPPGP